MSERCGDKKVGTGQRELYKMGVVKAKVNLPGSFLAAIKVGEDELDLFIRRSLAVELYREVPRLKYWLKEPDYIFWLGTNISFKKKSLPKKPIFFSFSTGFLFS